MLFPSLSLSLFLSARFNKNRFLYRLAALSPHLKKHKIKITGARNFTKKKKQTQKI